MRRIPGDPRATPLQLRLKAGKASVRVDLGRGARRVTLGTIRTPLLQLGRQAIAATRVVLALTRRNV